MALTDSEQVSFEKQVVILVSACVTKLRALGLPLVDVRVIDTRSGEELNLNQLVQMVNGTLPDPTPPSLSRPEGVKEIDSVPDAGQ